MKVEFFGSDKTTEVTLDGENTVLDVFKKLNIPIETYIVQKEDMIVTEIEHISDRDKLVFIKVASGG